MARKQQLHPQLPAKGVMVCIVAVLAMVCVPTVAMAEEEPADEEETAGEAEEELDEEEIRRQAARFLRIANDAFDDENYERAYDHYVKAYDLLQEPMMMYRMGQTAQKIGEITEAVEHYQTYRDIGDDEEYLTRIEDELPDLLEKLPVTIEVTSEPEGAQIVAVDTDEEIGQTPQTVEVEPGDVHLALRLQGYEGAELQQEFSAGDDHHWEAVLERDETEMEMVEAEEELEDELEPMEMHPSVKEPVEVEEVDDSSLAMWGWTSAGLGVSMLALGGVMTYFQIDTTDEVNEFDRGAVEWEERQQRRSELESLRDDARTYHRLAMVSFISGGVLAATGAGILVYDAMGSDDSPGDTGMSLQAGVGPDGSVIGGLRGRF